MGPARLLAAILVATLAGIVAARAWEAPAASAVGTRWYFAEGSTLAGFTPYMTLLNPGAQPAAVTIRWSLSSGAGSTSGPPEQRLTALTVGPGERKTVEYVKELGLGWTGVATTVESDRLIVAERPLYLEAAIPGLGVIQGATVATGVAEPRAAWFFAEGSTLPGFREYITLYNPDPGPVTVRITYAIQDRFSLEERSVVVLGGGRSTVDVASPSSAGSLGYIADGVATTVTATDGRIVAERPMYVARVFGGRGLVRGATLGSPAAAPATRWSFAEGTMLDDFAQYLTILNPGTEPSTIDAIYRLEDGQPVRRTCTAAPRSRMTIGVFDPTGPCGIGRDVTNNSLGEGIATTIAVTAGSPVVAERILYFARGAAADGTRRTGAHAALGRPGELATMYAFAEGSTRAGLQPYWTITNPLTSTMTATITYLLDPSGPQVAGAHKVARTVIVPGGTRVTIDAGATAKPGAIGPGLDFGARVSSGDGRPFDVERPLYTSGDGHVGGGIALDLTAAATAGVPGLATP